MKLEILEKLSFRKLLFAGGLLLLFGGMLLLVLGFCDVGWDPLELVRTEAANYWLAGMGTLLVAAGLVAVFVAARGEASERSSSVRRTDSGLEVLIGKARVVVSFGRIEEKFEPGPSAAVVLPANEYFDDECVRDPKHALGAYLQKRFAGRVHEIIELVASALEGREPKEVAERAAGDKRPSYDVGSSVYLKEPLSKEDRLILVAVTTMRAGEGIRARAVNVFRAIEEVRRVVADERIDEVVMPVLGSGHGGMSVEAALTCMLLALQDALRIHPTNCRFQIVVFDGGEGAGVSESTVERLLGLVSEIPS